MIDYSSVRRKNVLTFLFKLFIDSNLKVYPKGKQEIGFIHQILK